MLKIYAPGSIDFSAWANSLCIDMATSSPVFSKMRTLPKIFNSISSKSPKVAVFKPRMLLITLTDLKFKRDWVRRQRSH